jgi:hypothetical protein
VIKQCLRNSITRRSPNFRESVDRGGTHAGIVICESIDERRNSVLRSRGGDRAQCLRSNLRVRIGESFQGYRVGASNTRRRDAAKSADTNLRARVTGGADQGLPGFAVVGEEKGSSLRAYGRIIVGKQRPLGRRAGVCEDTECRLANRGVTVGNALPRSPDGGGAAQTVERFKRLGSDVRISILERRKESTLCGFELEVS